VSWFASAWLNHSARVPPNCRFELDDIEQPWTSKPNTADFIFCRDPIASVRDFPKLLDQSFVYVPRLVSKRKRF
jgi:hypothetical protein